MLDRDRPDVPSTKVDGLQYGEFRSFGVERQEVDSAGRRRAGEKIVERYRFHLFDPRVPASLGLMTVAGVDSRQARKHALPRNEKVDLPATRGVDAFRRHDARTIAFQRVGDLRIRLGDDPLPAKLSSRNVLLKLTPSFAPTSTKYPVASERDSHSAQISWNSCPWACFTRDVAKAVNCAISSSGSAGRRRFNASSSRLPRRYSAALRRRLEGDGNSFICFPIQ